MVSQAWTLLSCLLLTVVIDSHARRLRLTVVRTPGNFYCANVHCIFDANDEDGDKFNTNRITIFDVTQPNVRGKVASLTQNENLYIDPARAKELNGTGSISKYQAELAISISDPDDCKNELFQCEAEFVNIEGNTELIQKSITTAAGSSADSDSDDDDGNNECRCSLINYRFDRLRDMGNEAKRALAYASDKDNEFAADIAQLKTDGKATSEEITRLQHATEVNLEQIDSLKNNDRQIQENIDSLRRNDAVVENALSALKQNDQANKGDIDLLRNKDVEMDKQIGELHRIDRIQGEALNNISHSQSVTKEDISQLKHQDGVFDNEIRDLRTVNNNFKDAVANLTDTDRQIEKQINELRKNDKLITQGINGLRKNDTAIERALRELTKKDNIVTEDIAKLRYFDALLEDDLTKLRQNDNDVKEVVSRLKQRDEVVTGEITALKSKDEGFTGDIQKLIETDTSLQKQIDALQTKDDQIDAEIDKLISTSNAQYELLNALKVNDRLLEEKIARYGINSSALHDQVNAIWNQHKVIDQSLVSLTVRVASIESFIDSSQVTTVTRTTTNLVLTSCTRGEVHDSPRVQFLLNGVTPALCDTETDGGGWIVIQKRSVGDVDFYRGWNEYRNGFGSPNGDHYLGNEVIRGLTANGYTELRIDVIYNGAQYYAHYGIFGLDSESSNYKLSVGNYHGTAGDSLTYHHGMPFTTFDRDNDKSADNCAVTSGGAWWYNSCHRANLNGRWGKNDKDGVIWKTLSETLSLTYTEIKIRFVA